MRSCVKYFIFVYIILTYKKRYVYYYTVAADSCILLGDVLQDLIKRQKDVLYEQWFICEYVSLFLYKVLLLSLSHRKSFLKRRRAVLVLQKNWRAYMERKLQRQVCMFNIKRTFLSCITKFQDR